MFYSCKWFWYHSNNDIYIFSFFLYFGRKIEQARVTGVFWTEMMIVCLIVHCSTCIIFFLSGFRICESLLPKILLKSKILI